MNRVLHAYREISYALLFLMYTNSAVPAYKEFAKRLIWDTAITRCGKYQSRDLIIYRFPLVDVSVYNHILPCLIKFHYWCTNECSGFILHNLQDSWSWCACSPKVRMRTLGMHEERHWMLRHQQQLQMQVYCTFCFSSTSACHQAAILVTTP